MAKRCIGVLGADESESATPHVYVSKNHANTLLRRLEAVPLRSKLIKLVKVVAQEAMRLARALWDGPLGIGNALPFSRQSDGSRLHYEMPHAGDVGLWKFCRKKIQVSARPDSQLAATFIGPRTRPFALAFSPNASV
jgi:hypothetical protein